MIYEYLFINKFHAFFYKFDKFIFTRIQIC